MTDEMQSAVQVAFTSEGPAQSLVDVAVRAATANSDPVDGWYPLVPFGKFEHAVHGGFEITPDDADDFIANFDAGLPWGKAGIPIDEDGFHRKQVKAYARITKLDKRADAIYGFIVWGDLGKQAIAAGEYMYISPTFFPRGRVFESNSADPTDCLIISAALTNGPFFAGQPGLFDGIAAHYRYTPPQTAEPPDDPPEDDRVAASAGAAPDTQDPDTGAETPPEVTHQMTPEQIAKVRETYEAAKGKVSDEDWTKLTEGFETEEQWQEFEATIGEPPADKGDQVPEVTTISRAELERLQAKAAEAENAVEHGERLEKELQEVKGSVAGLTAKSRRLELESAVQASVYDGKRPAPSAVQAIVDLQMNPCDETVKAFLGHLEENRGKLALFAEGETAAVKGGATNDEDWFESKEITAEAKAAVRAKAAEKSMGIRAAYFEWLDEQNTG